jgi:GNAT superfamily N-acetyltransferase
MEIRELNSNEPNLLRQALEIYEEAFPVEERDAPEVLMAAIQRREAGIRVGEPGFHFRIALENGQVGGLAIFHYYPETRLGFIPYLAVHPVRRNSGLGAQLYQHLVNCVREENSESLGVCFEVERPELAKNTADADLRRRRIGFYQRNGARLVEPLYLISPPMGPGLPENPYLIMLHPFFSPPDRPLERGDITAVVRTVLEFSYGLPAESDYIRRAIQSIEK